MFTAFRYDDEPTERQPRLSPPEIKSSSQSTSYSRTACDFCRAKKVECVGTGEACDWCLTSSSTCTYTFSSGVGPGKKRRRKVWDQRFDGNTTVRAPISLRSGSPTECDDRRRTSDPDPAPENDAWDYRGDVASMTPREQPGRSAVTTTRSKTSRDQIRHWSDTSLSGSGFALCPAKYPSAVPSPTYTLQAASHSTRDFDNQLEGNDASIFDQDVLQLFDLSSTCLRDERSSTQPQQHHLGQENTLSADLELTPPFTPQDSSGSAPARCTNKSLTSQVSGRSSHSVPDRCSRPSAVLHGLEELCLKQNTDIGATQTDVLFSSVEQGIDQFSPLMACVNCRINDLSSTLVVTAINRLALILSELVHRLTHCQSPDTVPTVFQFGQYSVQKTKMRTSLLTSMIQLHVRYLSRLITRLEGCMADQPRLLLAGAKSIVNKMQQTLQTFKGGSYDDL